MGVQTCARPIFERHAASQVTCGSDLGTCQKGFRSRWIFEHFGLIASDGMLRPVVSERFPTGRMIASVRGDAPVPNICIKPFFAQSAGELQGPVEALLQSRRSEEHTSELQSLMRISYAVCCFKKKKRANTQPANPKHNGHDTSQQRN